MGVHPYARVVQHSSESGMTQSMSWNARVLDLMLGEVIPPPVMGRDRAVAANQTWLLKEMLDPNQEVEMQARDEMRASDNCVLKTNYMCSEKGRTRR